MGRTARSPLQQRLAALLSAADEAVIGDGRSLDALNFNIFFRFP